MLFSQVPGLGHIPNIVKSMGSTNDAVVKSAVQVVHLLSANEVRNTIKSKASFLVLNSFYYDVLKVNYQSIKNSFLSTCAAMDRFKTDFLFRS